MDKPEQLPTVSAQAEPCLPERRFVAGEVRAVMPDMPEEDMPEEEPKGKMPHLRGYAAVFNQVTDLGYFREVIEPGAFKRAIVEDDVRALCNHDPGMVLGRNRAGTLTLSEDDHGLMADMIPPSCRADVVECVQRGDVTGMSFQFRALREEWDYQQEPPIRRLLECELWDVGPATFPAYQGTSVYARTATGTGRTPEDVYRGQELARRQAQPAGQEPGLDAEAVGQEPDQAAEAERMRMRLRLRAVQATL